MFNLTLKDTNMNTDFISKMVAGEIHDNGTSRTGDTSLDDTYRYNNGTSEMAKNLINNSDYFDDELKKIALELLS